MSMKRMRRNDEEEEDGKRNKGRWKHTEQNRELQYMGNNSLLKISSFTYYDVTYLLFVYNELFFINTNTR